MKTMNIDIEKLLDEYCALEEKTMSLNGWGFSEEDDKRRAEYNRLWREWDESKIKEFKLEEYLGKDVMSDLKIIMDDNYAGGVLFDFLVEENEDGITLNDREKIISLIKEEKDDIEFKKQTFYCDLRFKTKIKEFFYAGSFLSHKDGMDMKSGGELLDNIMDSDEDFMPTLKRKIEELMGEGNFLYDGWELGSEDFGMYWNVRKDVFESFIDKFIAWIKYEELQDCFLHYYVYDAATDEGKIFDIDKKEKSFDDFDDEEEDEESFIRRSQFLK